VISWVGRLVIRMSGVLLAMALVEFGAFLTYREWGVNRLVWVPVSFALVALAGFDTVKRLPLVWGAVVGAVLAGATNLVSWPLGELVFDGRLAMPDEADPLLVLTALAIAMIVGAIVGVTAGLFARGRRRKKSHRSAIGRLAYTAFDETAEDTDVGQSDGAAPAGPQSA